jgi:hypothetical protein
MTRRRAGDLGVMAGDGGFRDFEGIVRTRPTVVFSTFNS